MYIKSIFSCPVCGKELKFDERSYKCESGHCFDRSKSGYVNLLTSDKMHSKLPGDNKLMVRILFLSGGKLKQHYLQTCGKWDFTYRRRMRRGILYRRDSQVVERKQY